MFVVGEAVIEEEIAQGRFSCHLSQCLGACCTLPGGRGAPLKDSELPELQRAFPAARNYLSEKHLRTIEREGLFEGEPGSYSTVCVDDRDCVLVFYDGNIARCSLEKAHGDGKTEWRKPLSCHLFPIRISTGGMDLLRYEHIAECSPGRTLGQASDVPLYDFLKDALVRRYGKTWYEEFRTECLRRDRIAIRG